MWTFTYEKPSPGKEAHISRIVIDNEWNVPVRYIAFGFPEEGQDEPPLLEEYQYENFEFNTGLTDEDFSPENPDYDFP
jgi:outer membrane lipoprotein-sorting protein